VAGKRKRSGKLQRLALQEGTTFREKNMTVRKFVITATAALAFATLSNAASASPEAWDRADNEYQVQRYAAALEIYQQLAATGDARAAELAGHMYALGETFYGDAVRRDPAKAAQLLSQAARAGRPVAAHLLRKVNLASAAPVGNP
jgi:TPR repeat protein